MRALRLLMTFGLLKTDILFFLSAENNYQLLIKIELLY